VDSVVADSDTDSDTDDSDDDDAFNEQNDTSVNEAPGELACESADEQGTWRHWHLIEIDLHLVWVKLVIVSKWAD